MTTNDYTFVTCQKWAVTLTRSSCYRHDLSVSPVIKEKAIILRCYINYLLLITHMECAPCAVPTETEPVVLDQISIQLAALADSFRDLPHTYGIYQDIVKVERIFRKCFNSLEITNYQTLSKYCTITVL